LPFKIGPFEIIAILLVIFIVFGAGKLPQFFEMFGKWKQDFKKHRQDDDEESEELATSKTRKKAKKG